MFTISSHMLNDIFLRDYVVTLNLHEIQHTRNYKTNVGTSTKLSSTFFTKNGTPVGRNDGNSAM